MTRRRLAALALAAGLSATAAAVTLPGAPTPTAEAAPVAQRVLLVSDSVGLGTRGVFDDAFPADWEANVIGKPAAFVESLLSAHLRPAMALTPWMLGDHVVIAGGYNYPYWDPERFDRSIDDMVNTLTAAGVKHVHWVTLREVKPQYISASAWRQVQPYYWYFPTVNEHLRNALGRHPNLHLVDWAANADQPGLTYDAIHLNRTGAELYSRLVRQSVDRAATRLADRQIVEIDVTDDPEVTAAMVNLTAVHPRRIGFTTAFPCDEPRPQASQMVYRRDDVVAGGTMVPVDDEGRICAYNLSGTDLVVDVSGTFTTAAGVADLPPNRVFDSRIDPGRPLAPGTHEIVVTDGTSPVTGPVALTIGAVFPDRPGFAAAHPCGDDATTVTVNLPQPGRSLTNMTIVEPDEDGRICVTTAHAVMDLVVDRTISFVRADDPTPAVEVVAPHRVIDTRLTERPGPRSVIRFSISDTTLGTSSDTTDDTSDGTSGFGAVGFNLGVIAPDAPGFATVWPCASPRPATSNINVFPGDVLSNFVVGVADDDGDICISATVGAHLTVDVLAGLTDGFDATLPRRAFDTRQR